MPNDPPAELKAAVAEGRALIVCGAGVSRAASDGKAPGWEQLIRDALTEAATSSGMTQPWVEACKAFLASVEVKDWLNAANTIQQRLAPVDGSYRLLRQQAWLSEGDPTRNSRSDRKDRFRKE